MANTLQPAADMPDDEAALFARLSADITESALAFTTDQELVGLGEILVIDALKRRSKAVNTTEILGTLSAHGDVDDAFRVIARSRIMEARGIPTQRTKPPQEN